MGLPRWQLQVDATKVRKRLWMASARLRSVAGSSASTTPSIFPYLVLHRSLVLRCAHAESRAFIDSSRFRIVMLAIGGSVS